MDEVYWIVFHGLGDSTIRRKDSLILVWCTEECRAVTEWGGWSSEEVREEKKRNG